MNPFSVACQLIQFAGDVGVASARFHMSPAAARGRSEGESGGAAKLRLLQGGTHPC